MKNLKKIELLMMLSSRHGNPDYVHAFNTMTILFRFKDKTEHTNHCKIINMLYNVKVKNYKFQGIADKMHISDNALRRYRCEYTGLFSFILENSPSLTAGV